MSIYLSFFKLRTFFIFFVRFIYVNTIKNKFLQFWNFEILQFYNFENFENFKKEIWKINFWNILMKIINFYRKSIILFLGKPKFLLHLLLLLFLHLLFLYSFLLKLFNLKSLSLHFISTLLNMLCICRFYHVKH